MLVTSPAPVANGVHFGLCRPRPFPSEEERRVPAWAKDQPWIDQTWWAGTWRVDGFWAAAL